MFESQRNSVEKRARSGANDFVRRRHCAVPIIANERVTDSVAVHANLMCSPGLQFERDQGDIGGLEPLQNGVRSSGWLAVRPNRLSGGVSQRTSYRSIDDPLICGG